MQKIKEEILLNKIRSRLSSHVLVEDSNCFKFDAELIAKIRLKEKALMPIKLFYDPTKTYHIINVKYVYYYAPQYGKEISVISKQDMLNIKIILHIGDLYPKSFSILNKDWIDKNHRGFTIKLISVSKVIKIIL